MELAWAIWSQVVAVRLGVSANVAAEWSQSADRTALTDPVTDPLISGSGCAPRGIRTPNRQIRSLVTVGSYTDPLGRTSLQWMELSTLRSDTRAGGAPVSRIRRSDPGCRGEDYPIWSSPCGSVRNASKSRKLASSRRHAHLPVDPNPGQAPSPGRRPHDRDPSHRGTQVPQSSSTTRDPTG
jgi:hypothetical protein